MANAALLVESRFEATAVLIAVVRMSTSARVTMPWRCHFLHNGCLFHAIIFYTDRCLHHRKFDRILDFMGPIPMSFTEQGEILHCRYALQHQTSSWSVLRYLRRHSIKPTDRFLPISMQHSSHTCPAWTFSIASVSPIKLTYRVILTIFMH